MKKKKLSNFVLFPLVLGTTCIVCAGTLAAVNYAVHGTIEGNKTKNITKKIGTFFKDNKGYKLIYEKGNASVVDENPIVETPAEFDSHIVRCYRVTTKDDKTGLVYQATTENGYSGNLDIVAGVFNGAVIGLASLGGTEDTLGINAVNKFSEYLSWDNKYAAGDEFKAMTDSSGASAQATFPVLQATLDILLADEANRVKVATGSISSEVSVNIVQNDISTVKFEATATSDNQYAAMKAEVIMNVINLNLTNSKNTLASVTIKDYDGSESSNAGEAVLKGTATDNFTKNYVLSNNAKLSLRSFRKTLAKAEEEDKIFEGCEAPSTAKGYYLLMHGIYEFVSNHTSDFTTVKKNSDTEYQVMHISSVDGSADAPYASMVLTATVDKTKSVFTGVTLVSCVGTEGYGKNIITGNTEGLDSSIDQSASIYFINNYVKIPDEGLPFNKFENEITVKDKIVDNGATYTSFGYYTALRLIVVAINEGK